MTLILASLLPLLLFVWMIWYAVRMDQNQPAKIGPKDVFLHLLAIGTLYASAVSFCTLLFQYINRWFPNVGADYYYNEGLSQTIRYAVSVLIVVFPVYFWLSRTLRKMYEADPGRVNLGIRKWLSYFTVFLAAVIAIGWLVAVINTYLNGDFTTAFLLKALVIFFATGSIFYYYLAVIKGQETLPRVRYFAYFAALVVLAAIVGAFLLIGSPQNRRAEREDTQRINDLQNIQGQIGNYFQAKEKLPGSLTDLKGAFGDNMVPKDPAGQDYDYVPGEGTSFELCTTFALPTGASRFPPSYPVPAGAFGSTGNNWQHGSGRICFQRTIDPAYFRNPAAAPYGKY